MDIIIKYNETICIRTNFTKCLSRQLTYIKVKYIFAKLILFFNNELHEYQIQNKIPLKCTNRLFSSRLSRLNLIRVKNKSYNIFSAYVKILRV